MKILDDPSYKPKPDSTELMGTKKLRLARIPGKRNRWPGNPDEPVCIAGQGRRVGLEEQGDDGVVVEERITDGSVAGPWCSLPCRSIRIGNYKVRNEVPVLTMPNQERSVSISPSFEAAGYLT